MLLEGATYEAINPLCSGLLGPAKPMNGPFLISSNDTKDLSLLKAPLMIFFLSSVYTYIEEI